MRSNVWKYGTAPLDIDIAVAALEAAPPTVDMSWIEDDVGLSVIEPAARNSP